MSETTIRILQRDKGGYIEDLVEDFSTYDFAGIIPSVGDRILNPGVAGGLERDNPKNRTLWIVVERFFNLKDNRNYVGLVVEERPLAPEEYGLA
jgi:hypothetical protein